jgi:hypothetical protein
MEITMRIDKSDFERFAALHAELTQRAKKYFEARAKTFNPELRHEIVQIDFDSDGCSITYRSTHSSNCRGDIDELSMSIEGLMEFNEE